MYAGWSDGRWKRKRDPSIEEERFEKRVIRVLRYEICEPKYKKRYAVWSVGGTILGARLVDVASKLKAKEEDVWRAIETSTHIDKGRRYWWEKHEEDTWVGANWWPDKAGETSLWPPLGGQYFRCPNGWTREEGEGLVDYIGMSAAKKEKTLCGEGKAHHHLFQPPSGSGQNQPPSGSGGLQPPFDWQRSPLRR